jgi:DNA-binding transcriptional ArsR family regulator
LAKLALGETSVAELSKPFSMSAPAVTKHLKVLQRAGLVRQGRQAQWRPCKLQAAPLREAADWVAQYRQHWEGRPDINSIVWPDTGHCTHAINKSEPP